MIAGGIFSSFMQKTAMRERESKRKVISPNMHHVHEHTSD